MFKLIDNNTNLGNQHFEKNKKRRTALIWVHGSHHFVCTQPREILFIALHGRLVHARLIFVYAILLHVCPKSTDKQPVKPKKKHICKSTDIRKHTLHNGDIYLNIVHVDSLCFLRSTFYFLFFFRLHEFIREITLSALNKIEWINFHWIRA